MTWELIVGFIFLFLLLGILIGMWDDRHRRIPQNHLLLVTIPNESKQQDPPRLARLDSARLAERNRGEVGHTLSEIGLTAELFSRLSQFKVQFAVEVAVHQAGEEIHFYVVVPYYIKDQMIEAIQSIIPEAKVEPAHYDLWMENAHLKAAYLSLVKPHLIPLKPAVMPVFDPFLPILRHLSSLKTLGEGVAIQWIIKPASARVRTELSEYLHQLRTGRHETFRLLHEDFLITPETVGLLEEKLDAPLYAVNCRILAASLKAENSKRILDDLEKPFQRSSHGMLYNEIKFVEPKNLQKVVSEFFSRQFDQGQEIILNAHELAALFHFPTSTRQFPKLKHHAAGTTRSH